MAAKLSGEKSWIRTISEFVEHFSELVAKYTGKYVAVVNEMLVAVGETRRDVETKAREVEPNKIPSVLRVPREEDMVYLV